jgi:transposase
MYLMTSTRCGISAKQLERELGVTYKTAWRMARLIRSELMMQGTDELESAEAEMDETYVGGVRKGKPGRPGADSHKTPVFGIADRKGHIVALTVPNVRQKTLLPIVRQYVIPATTVYTDEFAGYNRLAAKGYDHKRINHSEGVYVSGDIHVNTVEGFWSLVKRGIDGVYHSVSRKHLQGYVNEYAWRYNQRGTGRAQFSAPPGVERPTAFDVGFFAIFLRFAKNSLFLGTGISWPFEVF